MRIACWITNATNAHSEQLILIFTVTIVTRTRLSVTFIPTLPVLSLIPLVFTHFTFLSTGFSPKILNSYTLSSVQRVK
jgi:hypothetical protein